LVGTYEYHEVAFRVFVSMLDQHYHTFHVRRCMVMFSGGICAKCY